MHTLPPNAQEAIRDDLDADSSGSGQSHRESRGRRDDLDADTASISASR